MEWWSDGVMVWIRIGVLEGFSCHCDGRGDEAISQLNKEIAWLPIAIIKKRLLKVHIRVKIVVRF